jgi:hypothetical protein
MAHDELDDWEAGELIFVSPAWRDDGLWDAIQIAAQQRIGSSLREAYSEFLRQPLSPSLQRLAQQIELRFRAS